MTDIENTQEVSEAVVATPLDSILGGGEPSSQPDESRPQEPEDNTDRHDDPVSVPLAALQRERRRRLAMDQRVAELEKEVQAYNEQKWGMQSEESAQPQEAQPSVDDATQKERERQAFAYNQSYAAFVAKHGKDRVAEIDAALNQLPPEQQAHVLALVRQGDGDPLTRIASYVEQIGALGPGFHPANIQDVLSGKAAPEQPVAHAEVARLQLEERQKNIEAAERRVNFQASRFDFVSEFGKEQFSDLSQACETFARSNDPRAAQFTNMLLKSRDPIRLAAEVMSELGMWSPRQATQQQPARQAVMPSNLVSARSVGSRSGPSFAGPTPLKDIFARG